MSQIELLDTYRNYLTKFQKDPERLSNPARITQFSNTLTFIQNHPSDSPYQLGLTEWADLFEDEINSHFSSINENPSGNFHSLDVVHEPLLQTENDQSSKLPSVNWASNENPLGFSTVPYVVNQGSCGACWAFVSSYSVTSYLSISSQQKPIPFSVQELVDCSSGFGNRGCQGGNPVFAYQYIELHGLSRKYDYPPYQEKENVCETTSPSPAPSFSPKYVSLSTPTSPLTVTPPETAPPQSLAPPRAFIHGFSRLSPQREDLLLSQLSRGPVATGICGTDRSFMFYTSGIFSPPPPPHPEACCQTQNHAVLIVGYGVESEEGTVDQGYAKNSSTRSHKGERRHLRNREFFEREEYFQYENQSAFLLSLQNSSRASRPLRPPSASLHKPRSFQKQLEREAELSEGRGGRDLSQRVARPYWIIQNSWGPYWGERGFMRVARNISSDPSSVSGLASLIGSAALNPGVCGLLLNPSVPSTPFLTGLASPDEGPRSIWSRRGWETAVLQLREWLGSSWQVLVLGLACVALAISFSLFTYQLCVDVKRWAGRRRRGREVEREIMSRGGEREIIHPQTHLYQPLDSSTHDIPSSSSSDPSSSLPFQLQSQLAQPFERET